MTSLLDRYTVALEEILCETERLCPYYDRIDRDSTLLTGMALEDAWKRRQDFEKAIGLPEAPRNNGYGGR